MAVVNSSRAGGQNPSRTSRLDQGIKTCSHRPKTEVKANFLMFVVFSLIFLLSPP